MEQPTKKYFDKGLSNLIEQLDEKLEKFATKDDLRDALNAQSTELKQYVTESFEVQQEYMDERFNELIVKYDVRA